MGQRAGEIGDGKIDITDYRFYKWGCICYNSGTIKEKER